jgi:glutathione S-transferase
MLELYHHGSSVCAAKVRLALAEKAVAWEGHYVDILAGEQFRPEFLRLNPEAMVPVLVHDGLVVRESTVINEYVDEMFAGAMLRPSDSGERAAMRIWTKLVDETLHPAVAPITFAVSHRYTLLELSPDKLEAYLRATPDPVHQARKRAWVEQGLDAPEVRTAITKFARSFARMEAALATSAWLAGPHYSLADVALTPYLVRIEMLDMWDLWKAAHPRVDDWFGRAKARESFEPAVFQHMPAVLRQTMLANGRKAAPALAAIVSGLFETA